MVTLKFAWPAHLRCEVDHTTRATFSDGAPLAGNTVHLALDAVRGGDGWLVRQRVTSTTQEGAGPAPRSKKTDPHELEVLLYPPFTVTREGAFGGLELNSEDRAILDKRAAKQRQMAEMIKKLSPDAPGAPSEDALEAATKKAASTWNLLVGVWTGKRLPEGDIPELRAERDQKVPFFGTLRIVDHMTLARGAPCKPAPRGGCVRLEVTSDPAGAAPRGGGPDAGSAPGGMRFHKTATVVTDPKTLIPRSYSNVLDMSMPAGFAPEGAQPPPGKTMPQGSKVVETMTFRCR
jgi:hypothetical protein